MSPSMSQRSTRRLRSFVPVFTLASLVCAGLAITTGTPAARSQPQPPAASGTRPLVVVAVIDGLRPDSITRDGTPTLFRLRQEGVDYRAAHAAFPTVTRVNAATLSTGTWPERHGLVSNTMFVPAVHPSTPFSTGDWTQLVKLGAANGGRVLDTQTLAEIVQGKGLTFVSASSGSTGSAFLLNPEAARGIGTMINGGLEPGKRVALPDAANDAIMKKFGSPFAEGKAAAEGKVGVDWTERVLREHVVPELRPDLLMVWFTEPDSAQHEHGVGSPEARAGLQRSDRNLGLLLDALAARGPEQAARVHVMVTSDHGFARHGKAFNLTQSLVRAGLKASPTSNDVVVVSNGQCVLLHVKDRDDTQIERLVKHLQTQDDVDVIFTRAAPASAGTARASASKRVPVVQGRVPGTFALELVRGGHEARGADVLVTFQWSSAPNAFGVPGTQTVHSDSREGTLTGEAAGHGGLSPYAVHNTLLLWGSTFRRGAAIDVPAGPADIAPTVLALLQIEPGAKLDGRVLREAFRSGPEMSAVPVWSETVTVQEGAYRAALKLSGVGNAWYVDEGARSR